MKNGIYFNDFDIEMDIIIFLLRSASNNEENLISNRIGRATKAIDNAIGQKATGYFLTMPTVLNKYFYTKFFVRLYQKLF